jgi:hypothetical protein
MRSLIGSPPLAFSRLLAHALIWAYERTAGTVVTYMIEYRKAKVSEELYRHLSRLSDAELAARGLDHQRLAQFISQRLG